MINVNSHWKYRRGSDHYPKVAIWKLREQEMLSRKRLPLSDPEQSEILICFLSLQKIHLFNKISHCITNVDTDLSTLQKKNVLSFSVAVNIAISMIAINRLKIKCLNMASSGIFSAFIDAPRCCHLETFQFIGKMENQTCRGIREEARLSYARGKTARVAMITAKPMRALIAWFCCNWWKDWCAHYQMHSVQAKKKIYSLQIYAKSLATVIEWGDKCAEIGSSSQVSIKKSGIDVNSGASHSGSKINPKFKLHILLAILSLSNSNTNRSKTHIQIPLQIQMQIRSQERI